MPGTNQFDIFFLNPLHPQSSVLSQHALDEIISIIVNTNGLLRIAVAYFTHPKIASALIKRTSDKKKTLFLLNSSDILRPINPDESEVVISKELMRVIRIGSPLEIQSLGVRSKYYYQNMHHKFVVAPNRVIFGSLNWTVAALNNNFESFMISDAPEIIKNFQQEFDELWAKSESLFLSNGRVRVIICPKCKSAEGVDFESWGPFCIYCGHKIKVA